MWPEGGPLTKRKVIMKVLITVLMGLFLIACGAEEAAKDAEAAPATEEQEEVVEETPTPVITKELTDFTISAPTASLTTTDTTPTITWTESDYSETTTLSLVEDVVYDLVIASDSTCTTKVQEHKSLTGLTKTLDTALGEGTFYSCLTSSSQGVSKTATNNGVKFVVDVKPQAFTLAAISNTSATGATHSISLSWGASTNASYYLVTTDGTQSTTQITTTSTTVSVSASARAGTSHTIFATGYDAEGNSIASNSITMTAARRYALSELSGTYTVDDASALAKPSTYTTDLLLGVAYTCTKNSNNYVIYEFTDGLFFATNATSSGNFQVISAMSVATGWGYSCTAD